MELEQALKRYFGFSSFRGNQKAIVAAILAGKDVLTLMSTGGGKSLCFQLPAVLLPGMTLVISPLISLMEDQVAHLTRKKILSTWITHLLPPDETQYRLELLTIRHYQLVYVSPERLQDPSFCAKLQMIPISLVVVDEAHCISEWGHEFRPEYRQISTFLNTFRHRPAVAAFTATATLSVAQDIVEQLAMAQPVVFHTSVSRENLALSVIPCHKQHEKWLHTLALLQRYRGESGIMYTSTRESAYAWATQLKKLASCIPLFASLRVGYYHAGLTDSQRHHCQQQFQSGKYNLLCATTAFGMGIDKSDIRFVIHAEHPNCLESYFQQVGRAGRDRAPAAAFLLFQKQDYLVHWQMIRQQKNPATIERNAIRLQQMYHFCQTNTCRMQQIATYFGETTEPCQICDCCQKRHTLHPYVQTQLSPIKLDTIRQWQSNNLTNCQTVTAACVQPRDPSQWRFIPGCGKGWRSIWQTQI